MISLTCTSCRTTLSIDDAFAGGVCRCQHCGTIQTVPVHLKPGAAGAATATAGKPAKTLYRKRARAESGGGGGADGSAAAGSGLDDLADAVQSSGLTGSGLTRAARAASPNTPRAPSQKLKGLLIAASVVIVVLIAIIIWMTTRG
jgi:hypothetical protein